MLRSLGLGCFDGRILFRWRPSIAGLRSIHHNASDGHRSDPSDSPPATKKDPSWVMLNSYEEQSAPAKSHLLPTLTPSQNHTPPLADPCASPSRRRHRRRAPFSTTIGWRAHQSSTRIMTRRTRIIMMMMRRRTTTMRTTTTSTCTSASSQPTRTRSS